MQPFSKCVADMWQWTCLPSGTCLVHWAWEDRGLWTDLPVRVESSEAEDSHEYTDTCTPLCRSSCQDECENIIIPGQWNYLLCHDRHETVTDNTGWASCLHSKFFLSCWFMHNKMKMCLAYSVRKQWFKGEVGNTQPSNSIFVHFHQASTFASVLPQHLPRWQRENGWE